MIDRGLGRPWPQEVIDASDRFKQGHLIKQPPFFYATVAGRAVWSSEDDFTGADDSVEEEEFEIYELPPEERAPYGMITSQTCDIGGESARKHPWIQVAPVYEVTSKEVDSFNQRQYTLRLTAPDFVSGRWYVDLRIESPLEKSVLVGRKPIEAFSDEAGYLELARLLGRRRERAALASALVDVVVNALKDKRKSDPDKVRSRRVWDHLQAGGLRLSVVEGERLDPKQARLHVFSRGAPQEEVKDWFGEWYDVARAKAKEFGFAILATEFLDGTSVDAEYYRTLIDLGIVE